MARNKTQDTPTSPVNTAKSEAILTTASGEAQAAPESPAAPAATDETPKPETSAQEPAGASEEAKETAPPAPSDEASARDDAPPSDDHQAAPQLTDAEKGAPGKHLEAILSKFGHLPHEIIFVFDEKTEIAILTDGTKVTERMCRAILGDD